MTAATCKMPHYSSHMTHGAPPRATNLDDLRNIVRALEGRQPAMLAEAAAKYQPFQDGQNIPQTPHKRHEVAHLARLSFDVPAIDTCLGGGLVSDALHEIFPNKAEWDDGLTSAFALSVLSRLQTSDLGHVFTSATKARTPRPIVWITQKDTAGATLSAQGLMALGFDPDALFQIETRNDTDALWAFEEVLNHPELGAAVVELCHLDLAQSHRIQLRAQETQTRGRYRLLMMLRRNKGARQPLVHPTSAATRWRLGPVPPQKLGTHGNATEQNTGQNKVTPLLPRMAPSSTARVRWSAELFRQRGGAPGAWFMEWSYEQQRFRQLAGHKAP